MNKKVHLSPHLDEWWSVVRDTIDKIQGWRQDLPPKSGLALEGWADFVPRGLSPDFLIWTSEIAAALAGQTDPEDYLPEWMPRITRVDLQPIYRAADLVLAWADLQDRAWAQDHEGVMRILVGLPGDDELDDLADAVERLCGIKLEPKLPAVGTSNDPREVSERTLPLPLERIASVLSAHGKRLGDTNFARIKDRRTLQKRILSGEIWAFRREPNKWELDYHQIADRLGTEAANDLL